MNRIKKYLSLFLAVFFAGGILPLSAQELAQLRTRQRAGQQPQTRQLRIVSTTPELASMAASITQGNARINSITTGREDPHFLEARPSFVVMARDADLWLRMGVELEIGWEPLLLDGARNPNIRMGRPGHFDGGAYAAYILEIPSPGTTRAQGDVHPSGNPHYLLDPYNGRAVAAALAARLIQIDSQNRATYETGLAEFIRKLDTAMFGEELVKRYGGERLWKDEVEGTFDAFVTSEGAANLTGGWKAAMQPYKGKQIITFHKSFTYFAHRFGIEIEAELEPVPGVPPTPGHLAEVVRRVNQKDIRHILTEPFYPRRPADFVARQTNARVLVVNSYATSTSADGYIEMIGAIANAISSSR